MKRLTWLFLVVLGVSAALAQQGGVGISAKLVSITLLVKEYDEAAKSYSTTLGFQIQDNKDTRPGRRWVTMSSPGDPNFRIILHKPGTGYRDVDKRLPPDRLGKETFWILRTDDFDGIDRRLTTAGKPGRRPWLRTPINPWALPPCVLPRKLFRLLGMQTLPEFSLSYLFFRLLMRRSRWAEDICPMRLLRSLPSSTHLATSCRSSDETCRVRVRPPSFQVSNAVS